MLEQSRQYGYKILTSTFLNLMVMPVLPKIKDHKKLVEKEKFNLEICSTNEKTI